MDRDTKTFTLTEEHLTLLRAAWIDWDDCEFGAPAIDPKRPYGNSDVIGDMAELLGVGLDANGNVIDADRLRTLHRETQTALQIMVGSASLRTGEYRAAKYSNDWELVQ